MADQRIMTELLRAPTEGYAEAIVVPPILAEHFELKHSLINMMTSNQFFGLEKDNPYDHIRWFNKITSIIKYKDVPNSAIKLMLFPFPLAGAARHWLKKELHRSILTWEDLFHEAWDRYNDLLRACLHHGFTELHQLDTFYNALNPVDKDSLNSAAGGNLLERRTQDVLTIIENISKVRNSRNKSIVSQVKSSDATLPPASVKAIEEICVTCGGAHPYYQCLAADGNTFPKFRDNIQGYVSAAAVNYNQCNSGYRPPSVANQIRPPSFAQPNVQNNQNRFSQPQGYNRGNNFNQNTSYQAPIQQNQVVPLSEFEKIKKINEFNIKAMQAQINNVKNELRNEMQTSIQASMSKQTNELKNMMASFFQMNIASTSGSGALPSNTIASRKEDKRADETLTDPKLAEYTIKVLPHLVQKAKPSFLRNYVMLKALLSNKEKLLELANTPLNENCSAVILKKLPEKLGDTGKFLIPCGFSKLKCKALTDLGASINLMPLSIWKKLGLPELIFTRMTLELANRAICTPTGIGRDVFVPVGKFTFPVDFVIIDYESDPRVPLILGRPFLRTARALIEVYGEERILRDGDERLTLNMRHDTSSYSNQPDKESINMINIYNDSYEDYLEDLFVTNHLSGNPTFSSHTDLTSLKVINPLSGNTTSSSPDHLLEEFADELALITFPPGNDDLPFDIELILEKLNILLTMILPRKWILFSRIRLMREDKIKESKLLIDKLDPPRSSDFLPSPECDSVLYEDFSENFNPLLYELPFHKEVPGSETLLSFSYKNEEKVFNPGILTSKGVHTSLLSELSHRGPKAFRVIKIFESPMEIFPCSYGEDIHILDVPCLHFYPP
uniref:Reverse transcriptase domain-containing protein n=1 Tax=Tanacetum cinerariifolium TaxID=118510 RepID=A0A6L2JJI4_TANCI|nr:reverse transcriptase domain-containing protein [Tanacetum cinerariifolium]